MDETIYEVRMSENNIATFWIIRETTLEMFWLSLEKKEENQLYARSTLFDNFQVARCRAAERAKKKVKDGDMQ